MRLPVNNPVITSRYGWRILNGQRQWHNGIDLISRESSKVYSPFPDGVVVYDMDNYNELTRWSDAHMSGGNMICIQYIVNGIKYYMRFLHLGINIVFNGQKVSEGQELGYYANVGISYGAHTHNDLYDEKWVNLNIEEFYTTLGLLPIKETN